MRYIFKKARHICLAFLCFSTLPSCQSLTASGAYRNADSLALSSRWEGQFLETPHFTLKSYLAPQRNADGPMVIYIEGDGYAWVKQNWASPDPTPRKPFMLDVALQDRFYNAAYLARPCQYVIEAGLGVNCRTALWTDARFHRVVVADMNNAIDKLLAQRSHRGLILVGGSGGGTIAMLLAAQRSDISAIITLSGLINHQSWTRYHDISPLGQSMNPAALYAKIALTKQLHLLASEDDVIPPELSKYELKRLRDLSPATVDWQEVSGLDHNCCWSNYWAEHYQDIIGRLASR
ncbi:alpha/beta hydrolase [Thalassospira povalilytica]|nr:alpha/beta hydrolase [Thalassospira povalilytica]